MKWFGLSGLGMAFFGLYVFSVLLVLIVVHRLSGFGWTKDNLRLGIGALLATALVFLATTGRLPAGWGVVIGGLMTAAAGLYALRKLAQRAGCASLSDAWTRLRTRIKIKTP
jgi:PST family polysaccharide transporter